MAGSPIRRERRERTDALLADAETIDHICGDIASGATLSEWCKQRDVSFNVVNSWIEDHEDNKKRYLDAVAIRDSHNRDVVTTTLRTVADFDPAEAFKKEDNTLLDIHDMPISIRKAIVSITVYEEFEGRGEERTLVGYTKEIKFSDRVSGAANLGKTLKMLTEKREHDVTPGLADLLSGAVAK